MLLAPRFGETTAVVIELPFMVMASWFICGMILRRIALPPNWTARAAMGGLAFGVLIACEAFVGLALMGISVEEWLMRFLAPPGALGLAGQILFAAFPALRRG